MIMPEHHLQDDGDDDDHEEGASSTMKNSSGTNTNNTNSSSSKSTSKDIQSRHYQQRSRTDALFQSSSFALTHSQRRSNMNKGSTMMNDNSSSSSSSNSSNSGSDSGSALSSSSPVVNNVTAAAAAAMTKREEEEVTDTDTDNGKMDEHDRQLVLSLSYTTSGLTKKKKKKKKSNISKTHPATVASSSSSSSASYTISQAPSLTILPPPPPPPTSPPRPRRSNAGRHRGRLSLVASTCDADSDADAGHGTSSLSQPHHHHQQQQVSSSSLSSCPTLKTSSRTRYDMERVPAVVRSNKFWQAIQTWPPRRQERRRSSSRTNGNDNNMDKDDNHHGGNEEHALVAADSVLWVPQSRQEWQDCTGELLAVCTSAAWRRHNIILQNQQDQQPEDGGESRGTQAASFLPPLSKHYIVDRLLIDDPLRGVQIRHAQGGWLQGYLLWTNFTTWVHHFQWTSSSCDDGDDASSSLAEALNALPQHGTADAEGIVTHYVAEIALVGGLACGELLLRLALEQIRNDRQGNYKYVVLQATEGSRSFYQRFGFRKVGATCRYANHKLTSTNTPALSLSSSSSSNDTNNNVPSLYGPVQGYRHWTHAHESEASLELHGGPSTMMCLELPDKNDPSCPAVAGNLWQVMSHYHQVDTKPYIHNMTMSGSASISPMSRKLLAVSDKGMPTAPSLSDPTTLSTTNNSNKRKRGRGRPRRTTTDATNHHQQMFGVSMVEGGGTEMDTTVTNSPMTTSKRRKVSEDNVGLYKNNNDKTVLADLTCLLPTTGTVQETRVRVVTMELEVGRDDDAKTSNRVVEPPSKNRGPGRPRKSSATNEMEMIDAPAAAPAPPAAPDTTASNCLSAPASVSSSIMPPPKKRGPGRPRKYPVGESPKALAAAARKGQASILPTKKAQHGSKHLPPARKVTNIFAVDLAPKKPRAAAVMATTLIAEGKSREPAVWGVTTSASTSTSLPLQSKTTKESVEKAASKNVRQDDQPSALSPSRTTSNTINSTSSKDVPTKPVKERTPPAATTSSTSGPGATAPIMSAGEIFATKKKAIGATVSIHPTKLCKQKIPAYPRGQTDRPIWYNKVVKGQRDAKLFFVLDYSRASDKLTLCPLVARGTFARGRNDRPRYQCELFTDSSNWKTIKNASQHATNEYQIISAQAVMKTSMVAQEAWDVLPNQRVST